MKPPHPMKVYAAAPELLAALKYMIAWDQPGWSARKAKEQAEKAIKKAEGKGD